MQPAPDASCCLCVQHMKQRSPKALKAKWSRVIPSLVWVPSMPGAHRLQCGSCCFLKTVVMRSSYICAHASIAAGHIGQTVEHLCNYWQDFERMVSAKGFPLSLGGLIVSHRLHVSLISWKDCLGEC